MIFAQLIVLVKSINFLFPSHILSILNLNSLYILTFGGAAPVLSSSGYRYILALSMHTLGLNPPEQFVKCMDQIK